MMSAYDLSYAAMCSFQGAILFSSGFGSFLKPTGLKWTRTTDLTLIRRAL